MRHFIYTTVYAARPRISGGCNYTVTVMENKGRGKIVPVGSTQANTAAHRGVASEAWSVVLRDLPAIKRRLPADSDLRRGYANWSTLEKARIKLECIHETR